MTQAAEDSQHTAGEDTAGRVDPASLVRFDYFDPVALLTVWYLRKASTGLFPLGVIVLSVVTNSSEIEITDGPFGRPGDLFTAAGLIEFAILLRLATWVLEKALAYPLAVKYESHLEPRTNFGRQIGIMLDRYRVSSALGMMRFSHHVRQVALGRLGRTGSRVGLLDPILDVTNIVLWILAIVVLFVVAIENAPD